MSDESLAHSPRDNPPVEPQTYAAHVTAVRDRAVANARCAARFYKSDQAAFIDQVDAAAVYHDLGKVDRQNQDVLRRVSRKPLPIAHEDAGVAQLLTLKRMESAVLVAAHHAGLFSQLGELQKEYNGRRGPFRNLRVAQHVDAHLSDYGTAHSDAGLPSLEPSTTPRPLGKCGFMRRLALSCLVDADHGDTARHYGQEPDPQPPDSRGGDTRWANRLERLKSYVGGLPPGRDDRQRKRNTLRRRVFDACLAAPTEPAIRSCDAPVGSGKTTAVMAHLLQVAAHRRLRHIIVVLPYTNIIKQSVDVYRQSLVLEGEDPETIVAEHHHQADFSEVDARHLATLWKAPIIVTTAVQFFETLGSYHPARLRKLHELPGAAVFVDETHAAIPSHLWSQVWRWLEVWTRDWGGHLVLASGSLPRFWELSEFANPPQTPDDVPDLVQDDLRRELEDAEKRRVTIRPVVGALSLEGLVEAILEAPGPRLVILNTVQSAAVLAHAMQTRNLNVLHLSTALAPVHRDAIVGQIKERFRGLPQSNDDWCLVATSCVEAGMDFSFRSGFRESCSTASLIQVGGRVSREYEHESAAVWHFRINDPMLAQHPGFQVSQRVVEALISHDAFREYSPSELAKEAMRREMTEGARLRAEQICEAESRMEYPTVSALCRVIDSDTRFVIIDNDLADRVRRHEKVPPTDLIRHSVQMWSSRINAFGLEPIWPEGDLFQWNADYDPRFLGYMAGVMPLIEGSRDAIFLA